MPKGSDFSKFKKNKPSKGKIDIRSLPQGIFISKIRMGGYLWSGKVVIIK